MDNFSAFLDIQHVFYAEDMNVILLLNMLN